MITTVLNKSAGFYSQLFFLLNHYLYAKKNELSFKVKSDEWLFKFKTGWEDYFKNIDIEMTDDLNNNSFYGHHQQICECTITEYKKTIKEIFIYNDFVYEKIQKIKEQLSLKDNYDAIFIRRGDKLSGESNFVDTERYIDILLSKNPNCHTIFVQTDDYNCYLDVILYVKNRQLNINVTTLCKEELKGGMIIFNCNKSGIEWAVKEHNINKEYITTVLENLRKTTPIDQLNNEQIYEHTLDMLIGIDIVLEADIVICDYSSNVSRFIKLANKDSKNVFDVNNPEKDINWSNTLCPSFDLLF
jgi:hypothetical protein